MGLHAAPAETRTHALQPYDPALCSLLEPLSQHHLTDAGRMALGSEYGYGHRLGRPMGLLQPPGQQAEAQPWSMYPGGMYPQTAMAPYNRDGWSRRPLEDLKTVAAEYLDPLEGLGGLETF